MFTKKNKKIFVIILAVVFLAISGISTMVYMKSSVEDGEEERPRTAAHSNQPPTYIPLDMVLANLSDEGGGRMVQIQAMLVVEDTALIEKTKKFMPVIHSRVLLHMTKYSADEILSLEGKTALRKEIALIAAKSMGLISDRDTVSKKKTQNPIQDVVFSSFIVQ